MPRYKLSKEERTARAARREWSLSEVEMQLLTFMSDFGISGVQDFSGLYREMVGAFLEAGLEGELEADLGYERYGHESKETANRRNGHTAKSLKTGNGLLEIQVPRDRDGEFEPQLVKKHHGSLSAEIEAKIISLYAKGMTQSDIEAYIRIKYTFSTNLGVEPKFYWVLTFGIPYTILRLIDFNQEISFNCKEYGSMSEIICFANNRGIKEAGKNEKWLQDQICEKPGCLGLGEDLLYSWYAGR
ncbi:MAG: transposase [Chitinispirillales bacterium]|jgi:hypothetical protein|nr:transposase [Chitinispirillales bacterium]